MPLGRVLLNNLKELEMQDIILWLEQRTFAEWVAVASLLVAIVAFIFKGKVTGKKSVKASRGSVALGDNAKGNTINVTQGE